MTQSDAIYEAALNDNVLPKSIRLDEQCPNFRFCFLSEFKSSKPSLPIDFQVDSYVKSIQRNDIMNGRPPSIVVALLFYHGAAEWERKRLHDWFSPYLPQTILDYVSFPKYLVMRIMG